MRRTQGLLHTNYQLYEQVRMEIRERKTVERAPVRFQTRADEWNVFWAAWLVFVVVCLLSSATHKAILFTRFLLRLRRNSTIGQGFTALTVSNIIFKETAHTHHFFHQQMKRIISFKNIYQVIEGRHNGAAVSIVAVSILSPIRAFQYGVCSVWVFFSQPTPAPPPKPRGLKQRSIGDFQLSVSVNVSMNGGLSLWWTGVWRKIWSTNKVLTKVVVVNLFVKSFLQKGSHRQGGGCKWDEKWSVCAHI